MNIKLLLQGLLKYLFGVLLVGGLLFIPAGTIYFWYGWLFMIVLFVPMLIGGIYMFFKNPKLLKSRLNAKEKEKDQKSIVRISAIMFIMSFIIAGLNNRFYWISLPSYIIIIACILFMISYGLYAEILRENTYLSRTIEVKKNQKVIDTGLYSIIRHPMYAATIPMFLSIPIILDSPISFLIFLIYPVLIIKRIRSEEKVLEKELKGYKEYQKKVKYRLIPFIW